MRLVLYARKSAKVVIQGKTYTSYGQDIKMEEKNFSGDFSGQKNFEETFSNDVATTCHICTGDDTVNESMRIAVENRQYDIVFYLFREFGGDITNLDELLKIVGNECNENNAYGLLRGKILAEKYSR